MLTPFSLSLPITHFFSVCSRSLVCHLHPPGSITQSILILQVWYRRLTPRHDGLPVIALGKRDRCREVDDGSRRGKS